MEKKIRRFGAKVKQYTLPNQVIIHKKVGPNTNLVRPKGPKDAFEMK